MILVRTGCCCQYRYILVYLDTILGLEKLKTGVSGYRRNSILITRRNAKRIVVNKVLCMLSYCGVPEVGMFWFMNEHVFVFVFVLNHFHFPAQLVGGFTLSNLLDKSWSQVSSPLPSGTCLHFLSRIGFSIPTARRFSSNAANSRSRAFR